MPTCAVRGAKLWRIAAEVARDPRDSAQVELALGAGVQHIDVMGTHADGVARQRRQPGREVRGGPAFFVAVILAMKWLHAASAARL